MKSWLHFVTDASPVEAVYGKTMPSLLDLDLHELTLHRDGPRLSLRFDFRDFPIPVPEKWEKRGCNRVQIKLSVIGLNSLSIIGFSRQCQIDLHLETHGKNIRLRGASAATEIDVVGEQIMIDGISAYCIQSQKL
jgi:Immunity protein 50